MKFLCTKGILMLSLALLVVSAAACTQSKPVVPTPTLVPLAPSGIETQAPGGNAQTPGAPSANATEPSQPGGTDQTPATTGADQTPGAVQPGQPTPIIVENPTLLPTPTTAGETGPAGQPTTAPGGATWTCSNPYTVQPGEWFYAVARKCGVSPEALLAANPGINPNLLRPGQTLNIPGGASGGGGNPPPTPGGGQTQPSTGACSNPYTVQSGDTLFSIARKCNTTVAAIQSANSIPSPEYIFPGQQLRIP
jgi:LysM repeat protein